MSDEVECVWHRSRHTGRYFLFGVGYVERLNSRKWCAGLLYGNRRPVQVFPNMTTGKVWVESHKERADAWARTQLP